MKIFTCVVLCGTINLKEGDILANEIQVLLKNNTLIKAKYDFTALENRIINKVLYEIQIHPGDLIAEIKVLDIKNMTKNRTLHSAIKIEDILKKLQDNRISEVQDNGWTYTPILSGIKYNNITDSFEIGLSPIFLKLLNSYKKQGFSSVDLTKYATLDVPAAQRIYELLRVVTVNNYNKIDSDGNKRVEYKTKEIRECLKLENNYARFYDFRRFVIDAAVKEINKKKLMHIVNVEYIKVGRSVDTIVFIINDFEPPMYKFNKNQEEYIVNEFKVDADSILCSEDINSMQSDDTLDYISIIATDLKLSSKSIEKLYVEYGHNELAKAIEILKGSKTIITAKLKYLKGILERRKLQKVASNHKKKPEGRKIVDDESLYGWDEEK